MASVLMVAEKPSLAQSIAQILSCKFDLTIINIHITSLLLMLSVVLFNASMGPLLFYLRKKIQVLVVKYFLGVL